MPDTYVCACCRGTFILGDDDLASSEADRNGIPADDRAIVCGPCFETLVDMRDGAIRTGPVLN